MAFYKSKYTGAQIDQRLAQGTYDDAVQHGFNGTKDEFDVIITAYNKDEKELVHNAQQKVDTGLETEHKTIVGAINEIHEELDLKQPVGDYANKGEFEVFKDEVAATYATIEQLENADYSTNTEVDEKIQNIIGTAPEALDTLKELADSLNNDPNFATTITNQLSKKVDWIDYNNTKNIVLPTNGQIFGDFGGSESNSSLLGARIYNAGLENEEKQVEVGTSKVHLNLNSLDKVTVETPDGKESLVVESDIKLIPKEIKIPIRTLQDKVYTQEEILDWFGVEDIISLKKIIVYGGIQYVKYGLSLSTNPHYYKMPVEYVAFESANQIKLVFVGLNTRDDVASKYEMIMNLDGAIIEGNSNIKLTITSIELEDIDLSKYATKEELNDYALKSELPDVSEFIKESDLPKQYIIEEGAALQAGDEQHEFNIKSGGRVTVNSANEVVTYTPYPGEEGRKMLVLANNDSLTGTKTDGTGAPLAFMSKWDKIEIGNSTTSLNLNSLNGEITINDDKIIATTDQIPEAYNDTQLRSELQQTETGVATANSEIEKLQSGKQSIQDETLQTTNKTIVGAINELLVKVQELETRLAALEGTN